MWNPARIHLAEGCAVPVFSAVTSYHLEAIYTLDTRESDVYVYTYPKSGTNWMKNIVSHLVDGGNIEDVQNLRGYIPCVDGIFEYPALIEHFQETTARRRLAFSHFPVNMAPRKLVDGGEGKVVYVARNPKDVLVSGYNFWKRCDVLLGNFQDYFNTFLLNPGDIVYGDYYDHVYQWWLKRNAPNVLVVFYEDLKLDTASEIKRISEFLGCSQTDQQISHIVSKTAFSTQKKSWKSKRLDEVSNLFEEMDFFRKGEIGDWVNHFTVTQNRIFDEVHRRRTEAWDDPVPFKFEIDL